MEENEAIKILKEDSCYECVQGTNSPVNCEYGKCRIAEATRVAIKALEEIEQYRAIGTPEECRAAMEQEAKKVIEKYKAKAQEDIEAYGEDAVFGYCPVCGGLQNTVWNTKYCGDCGQRLDWSDEE